ncbi:MAG TPA: hypothetical protein VFE45_16095, partial [Coriobacteriia bacterium]|nr:hypothetical protein [Coriobacteriia bacterium]
IPYLPRTRNTSNTWGLRTILRDLYDWHAPVDLSNWRSLHGLIKERAADPGWAHSILDRLHVLRTNAEYTRRGAGTNDDRLMYSLEWGMVTRAQWGEFDTPLYELERCWSMPQAGGPMEIGGGQRDLLSVAIRSAEDARVATAHFVRVIPDYLIAMATHLSTDISYSAPSDESFERALARRHEAGPHERDIYASFLNELLLTELADKRPGLVFQFSFGAEPLPFETAARLNQDTIGQLALMVARHPGVKFQCNNATRHANQELCTLTRELPNFSLAGYWWHNFYPDAIAQIAGERLDMVPLTSQCGFFSDAYSVEWTYAKAVIVRKQLARAFAERVDRGQYTIDDALDIADAILRETPERLLGMTRRPSLGVPA